MQQGHVTLGHLQWFNNLSKKKHDTVSDANLLDPTLEPFLRRLYEGDTLDVSATDGLVTIARSKEVFSGHLDPNFGCWGLDKRGKATKGTEAEVYELVRDATFAQMFGTFAEDIRTILWGNQHQIVQFCKMHPERLHQRGLANFFPFEENRKTFVASVYVYRCKLRVSIHRLDYDYVWIANYRYQVVLPKLRPSDASST